VRPATNDHVIRAVGLGGRARAVVADTTNAVEELRRLHDSSPEVTAAVGRLATGALLLASTLEKITTREPLLTVEVDGEGPVGRLVATASPAGWVRAMATNPLATADRRDDGKLDVSGVVGVDGQLTVTRDPGIGEPSRGVVELVSGDSRAAAAWCQRRGGALPYRPYSCAWSGVFTALGRSGPSRMVGENLSGGLHDLRRGNGSFFLRLFDGTRRACSQTSWIGRNSSGIGR